MRPSGVILTLTAVLLGCSGKSDSGDVSDGRAADTGIKDTGLTEIQPDGLVHDLYSEAVTEVAGHDVPPEMDVSVCPFGCPPGFCDEDKGACLWCTGEIECPDGMWCKDETCVETFCVPGEGTCLAPTLAATCLEDGEAWDETQCSEGYACNAGVCVETICTPGDYTCEKGLKVQCSPNGSGWFKAPCPPGQGCFDDQCKPIQHNMLVVFDTSGSMASIGFLDTVPCICASCSAQPYPACEDANCPVSKLGMSKHVFNKFFSAEQIGAVALTLTRFPIRIKNPPVTKCNDVFSMGRGYYGLGMMDSSWMTGDDGSHVTADGSWFDKYIYEILSVSPPKTWEEDNLGQAQLWVNFNEEVGPTQTPCMMPGDCPGGFCAQNEGISVCWYHTDPELRAIGNTPLGRSMFYAGEVYRKLVMPDGKPCGEDADCNNRNYFCASDGTCKDPFAPCRSNMILLFTDGVEEPPTQPSEFFNPRVQAKRFRYGLGCGNDEDCWDGATCGGGLCKDYPHPYTGTNTVPMNSETPWRLQNYNGDAIRITTHVIDMSEGEGATTNMQIAEDGGGTYYHPDQIDPDELLEQMLMLLDIKQNLADCVPDYDD